MTHFDPHKSLDLAVDTSGYGLGPVICIQMGQRTTQFTRFKLHLLPTTNPEPLHLDPICDLIINNGSNPAVGNNQFDLVLRYRRTSKCKYTFTFSSDREGCVKDSV